MRVAFVGLKKDYREISEEYVRFFNKYHLEIPFYYAEQGGMQVDLVVPGFSNKIEKFENGGSFQVISEYDYADPNAGYWHDVVVHWRKWNEDLYDPNAINVLHTCDFNYSDEWKSQVRRAFEQGKLYSILCYRTWHQRNMHNESGLPYERLLTDMTLGVDIEIYRPKQDKNWYDMLWSSDPGRGLPGAIGLAVKLFQLDNRFRLHVCYPDYVKNISPIRHPAIVWHGNIPNGPKLWDLFNSTGILPYTSTFPEPSSRAHRQAQAAGSMVLYPPNMGSPSELIENTCTGFVEPISQWPELIRTSISDGTAKIMGQNAHEFALTQAWNVQAANFRNYFERLVK